MFRRKRCVMLNNFNFHHLKNDLSLHLCGTYHGIFIKVITVAYFKRCGEARRAEIISARLGLAWHVSVLDEENIAMLK